MPLYVVDGATTTHGGIVKAKVQNIDSIDGKYRLCVGDSFYCPKCKKKSTIINGDMQYIIINSPAALAGSTFTCGAKLLPNQTLSMREYSSSPSITSNLVDSLNTQQQSTNQNFDEQFVLETDEGDLLANVPYTIVFKNNNVVTGTTNSEGKTERIKTPKAEVLEIYLGEIT